jgi:asparagine synthase (glutamine-hydrolysing)
MSALHLAIDPDPARREQASQRMAASLMRQGLPAPRWHDWAGIRLGWHATPGCPDPEAQWRLFDGGLVACVGTLFYRGLSGAQALDALWLDFHGARCAASHELAGEYQVVLARDGRLWSFGDPLGMIKLYESADGRLLSTSWLACADAQPHRSIDPVGALDYLFNGANHGSRTVCEQVRIADPALVRELCRGLRVPLFGPTYWLPGEPFTDAEEALARIGGRLRHLAEGWAHGFPGRLRAALSGGFDSRLLLAAARATGQTPALHVYGGPDSADVRVAQAMDRALGLGLATVDKQRLEQQLRQTAPPDPAADLDFFDGLPIDGIEDAGADRQTRLAQSADGALALNGGGGEVLRNFFYLPDRPYRPVDLVQVFYSGFDPAAVRQPRALAALQAHLADTIAAETGCRGPLSRRQVELVYPLVRGRYWTSRNNSMAARCGHFLTPLLDPVIVKSAARLPLAWKDYGRFEARLIERLAPELAGLPLCYGFSPAEGPPMGYRLSMWLQQRRPPWLRAASARWRARAGARRAPAANGSANAVEGRPTRFEATDSLIDAAALRSPAQRARLLTLEQALAGPRAG